MSNEKFRKNTFKPIINLMSKIYNYSAFYVKEPFSESALNANATRDFNFYNLLKAWKGLDNSFPFNNAHDTTYNVRDNSNWESTLKPRLHTRLRNSKNIILFLSEYTSNSRALREEIDYGVNTLKLPIIVIYPDLKTLKELRNNTNTNFSSTVINLWNQLPIFRDSKSKIPSLHIPMDKEIIRKSLNNSDFRVNSGKNPDDYYYNS